MIIYRCDRCKADRCSEHDIIKYRVSKGLPPGGEFKRMELCDSCANNFEQSINNWLANWAFDPKKK